MLRGKNVDFEVIVFSPWEMKILNWQRERFWNGFEEEEDDFIDTKWKKFVVDDDVDVVVKVVIGVDVVNNF